MTVWAIRDWNATFENYRSRALEEPRYCSWPVRKDSESFRIMCRMDGWLQAFGLFALLVQLAARTEVRGVLLDDKGTLTPERISKRYALPLDEVKRSWDILSNEDVAWLIPAMGPASQSIEPSIGRIVPTMEGIDPTLERTPRVRARIQSSPLQSSPIQGGGPGEPDPAVPNDRLFRDVLRHYPRQEAIRGAYQAASDAAWRLAHQRFAGDIDAALAFLGDRVRLYATAKAKSEVRFIPMARKWFEDGRYNDDPSAWAETGNDVPNAVDAIRAHDQAEAARKGQKP